MPPSEAPPRVRGVRSHLLLLLLPCVAVLMGVDSWSDYRALHQPGDEIRLSNSNKDYLGVLRLIAPNASRLGARLATALADLRWVLA